MLKTFIFTADINRLSDARFLQDFEQGEFRHNPNPDNMVALTKWNENYSATLLGRENLNEDNFDATERLPELSALKANVHLFSKDRSFTKTLLQRDI